MRQNAACAARSARVADPDRRIHVRARSLLLGALSAALMATGASAAPMSRAQALAALARADAATRAAAVERLAEVGRMADASRVIERLSDANPEVRSVAAAAIWRIWSRSGDPAIDRLFALGLAQMNASEFDAALKTFDEIVRRKPAFAEGWNKRATIQFLLGRFEASLQDCDEVLKRNPQHFGALAGAGQIHLQLGDTRRALEFFRRALDVNPNLAGPAQIVPLLERQLENEDRQRT
jgi:tetratricopeptide (TPR) repeat protein